MKKVGTILGFLILWTGLAAAGTVGMDFTGLSGSQGSNNNLGGVYTYPYYFSVTSNGHTSTNVPLICDDFSDEISVGESWTATEYSLSSIISGANHGLFGSGIQYEEAGYYLHEIQANTGNSTNVSELNWVIWELMDHSLSTNSTYLASAADLQGKGLLLPTGPNVSALLADLNTVNYSNYVVYVPTQWNGGRPQEFIGTPEPASLALLASGLIGLAFKKRRK